MSVLRLHQFDGFTLVHFSDNSFFVALQPSSLLSTSATYAKEVVPGSNDNSLKFQVPILAQDSYQDGQVVYLVVVLKVNSSTQRMIKYSLTVNKTDERCQFKEVKRTTLLGVTEQNNQTNSLESTNLAIIVGCDLCQSGRGMIRIIDPATLEQVG